MGQVKLKSAASCGVGRHVAASGEGFWRVACFCTISCMLMGPISRVVCEDTRAGIPNLPPPSYFHTRRRLLSTSAQYMFSMLSLAARGLSGALRVALSLCRVDCSACRPCLLLLRKHLPFRIHQRSQIRLPHRILLFDQHHLCFRHDISPLPPGPAYDWHLAFSLNKH